MFDPTDLIMPTPLHLLAALAAMVLFAFRRGRKGGLHAWRWPLLLVFAWCWLATTPVFVHFLAGALEARYPSLAKAEVPANPVIVVLASGEPWEPSMPEGGQLDLASLRRTLTGVGIWQHAGGELWFSGTAGDRETVTVADRMAALAVAAGVDPAAVHVERQSTNTFENLHNTLGLVGETERPVLLVTSAAHMPRAMAVAGKLRPGVRAVPADFRAHPDLSFRAWWPSTGTLPMLGYALHEWAGLVYYRMRDWS